MKGKKGFLLYVHGNISPEQEEAYNDWYNSHLPHLLKVPGYAWAQRYVSIHGNIKYLSLYQINDESYFESLINTDPAKRHPVVNKDLDTYALIDGKRDTATGVYEQISGDPFGDTFLRSDNILSINTIDVEAGQAGEWAKSYEKEVMPAVLGIPGCLKGGLFRLMRHPALEALVKFGAGPEFLAIYELDSPETAEALLGKGRQERYSAAVSEMKTSPDRQVKFTWSLYRIISKHWPFENA